MRCESSEREERIYDNYEVVKMIELLGNSEQLNGGER